jgi:transcriptional regulator with XRE-family HTH domain
MNKLAYWRAKRELSVRQLAVKSGVTPATISRLETGRIKSHLLTLGRLANALNIDLTELRDLALIADHSNTL